MLAPVAFCECSFSFHRQLQGGSIPPVGSHACKSDSSAGRRALLNPDIDRFISIARQSGIADTIMVTTNGLLLHRMSDAFWENLDNVLVCLYPDIALKETYETFRKRAEAHHTHIWFQIVSTFRTTIVSAPQKKDWVTALIFRSCRDAHFFHCHMIHEGMLYKCACRRFCRAIWRERNRHTILAGRLRHSWSFGIEQSTSTIFSRPAYYRSLPVLPWISGEESPHRQLPINDASDAEGMPVTRQNSLDYRKLYREAWDYLFRRARKAYGEREVVALKADSVPMSDLAFVIPAYRGRFLRGALSSLAEQTDQRFCVYIGDDASPDNLEQIIEPFQDRLNLRYNASTAIWAKGRW